MSQFSGYIGNTPVPKGTQVIVQGTLPLSTNYVVVPGGYYTGSIRLYINGSRINNDNFIANDGTTIEFDSHYPAGTEYLVEHIHEFEVPNTNFQEISIINTKIYRLRYTSDLWSDSHIDLYQITQDDMFTSKYYNGARQQGSGGKWQVISLAENAPDDENGLNSDGYLYSKRGHYYIKFALVSTECSPLKFGKGSPLIKELYQVVGGFHGQPMTIGGFWEIGDQGGGHFIWDANKSKSQHDGGTVIDPNKVIELHGQSTVPTNYFNPASLGSGCWVRVFSGSSHLKWFGNI